jgi:phenylacetate-CoA ligase
VLANETPFSIAARRHLANDASLARELFGESRLPTLCQYDPLHRYFEAEDDQLLFTADGGIPLIRYRILDRGGIIPFARMRSFLRESGLPAAALDPPARDMPFVFVFGRSGFALSYYGANIYPENVTVGLEQPELASHVTGKFVMQLRSGEDQNTDLEIVIELAAGQEPSLALEQALSRSVRTQLERLNSEFFNYVPVEHRTPKVRLLPIGHPDYFPIGTKHRYTRP